MRLACVFERKRHGTPGIVAAGAAQPVPRVGEPGLVLRPGASDPPGAGEHERIEHEEDGEIARECRGTRTLAVCCWRHDVVRTGSKATTFAGRYQSPRASAAKIRSPPNSQTETTVRDRIAAYQLGSSGD